MVRLFSILWCFGGLISASLAAVQPLEEIQQAVVLRLSSIIRQSHRDFDVEVMSLDPRLRLPRCDRFLDVKPMREISVGPVSVKVQCPGEHPWTIYTRAEVHIFRQVVVLTQTLPKGALLNRNRVKLLRRDLGKLRQGFFTVVDEVLGRRLRRALPAGYVLNPQVLTVDKVIHRGEAVVIRAHHGALDVRVEGHALMDGAVGERIRVRNDRSRRIVEGVVHGPKEVWVEF